MNREAPFAVVMMYVPSEDRCYHTPFSAEQYDDPLAAAHLFMRSEKKRGDFPGSLWVATGNDAASEIRKDSLLRALGLQPEGKNG
jgi:hypothetical protein